MRVSNRERPTQTIAALLREALEQRNWSYSDLSKRSGVPVATISTHVTGEYVPRPPALRKYANALGLPEQYLMVLAGHATQSPTAPPPDLQAIYDLLGGVWASTTPTERELFWQMARTLADQKRKAAQADGEEQNVG